MSAISFRGKSGAYRQGLSNMLKSLFKGLFALVDAFARAFKVPGATPARKQVRRPNTVRCVSCSRFTANGAICRGCFSCPDCETCDQPQSDELSA